MPRIKKEPKSPVCQTVANMPPSGIRKFFDLVSTMKNVISLGVGEPDYVTPWHIREAGIYSLEKGYTMYTSNSGTMELREEIARYLANRYQVKYEPSSEILITTGVSEGLDLAMRAILNPGDEVIMSDPCYVSYSACVRLSYGVPVQVPVKVENNFELRAEDIARYITPKTRAILIGYPANPTGAMISRQKLLQIANLVKKHNLLVITDEIYARLVYGTEELCFAALPGMRDNTILLAGFSKAYAMTGWRLGYACGNPEIIGAMTKIHQFTMLCSPITAQKAAVEALRNGDASVNEMVEDYNRRRLLMVKGFNNIGLKCFEPKGAFYAFPSIQSTGLTSEEFSERLLKTETVLVVPGTAFGQHGEGYIRCCYATAMNKIEEALTRIKRFVEKNTQN
ncbi:MAG TPA: aminotransferase class I/II-fold pyridoxal phosphate-dependent enzyme [Dehalococcoidales bacterium]|nr:aminotransferase class I/II-fold pyridoxal phosphate-dependent enzyme [Dehalococcoidales bacterium]